VSSLVLSCLVFPCFVLFRLVWSGLVLCCLLSYLVLSCVWLCYWFLHANLWIVGKSNFVPTYDIVDLCLHINSLLLLNGRMQENVNADFVICRATPSISFAPPSSHLCASLQLNYFSLRTDKDKRIQLSISARA
jgi:hypothetical protein